MSDKVIRPSHYGGPDASCDPLSVMEGMDASGYASLAEAFAHANVLKLAWRVGKKAGEEESDREKLAFYALTLAFGRDAAEAGIRAARESMPEVTPQDMAGVFRQSCDAFRRAAERVSSALREVAAPATPVTVTAESPPSEWRVHELSAEQTDAEIVRVPVPTTDDLVAAGGAPTVEPAKVRPTTPKRAAAPRPAPPRASTSHRPAPEPVPEHLITTPQAAQYLGLPTASTSRTTAYLNRRGVYPERKGDNTGPSLWVRAQVEAAKGAPPVRKADPTAAGLLTSAQIAEQLGVTKEALGWHIQHGAICPVRIGKGGRPSLFEPAEVARFVAAREQARRPGLESVAAPAPKAVTEAPAVPVPSPSPAASPPAARLTLPPRPEPEMPRVTQAIEIRQRERRESVRLDRAIEAGRTQHPSAFVLCSREGDDGLEYRAFSNARAAIETGEFGWIVVCRYQKNGLGRWEEIGDGTGAPAPAGSNLARRLG